MTTTYYPNNTGRGKAINFFRKSTNFQFYYSGGKINAKFNVATHTKRYHERKT